MKSHFMFYSLGLIFLALQRPATAQAQKVATSYLQRIDQPMEMVTLDYQPKLTLLVFWKADCQGCDAAMRDADNAATELQAKGLKVYGVYADAWESFQDRAKLQIHSPLPQLHDTGLRLSEQLSHPRTPSWIVVLNGGNIVGHAESESERQDLLHRIRGMLNAKKD